MAEILEQLDGGNEKNGENEKLNQEGEKNIEREKAYQEILSERKNNAKKERAEAFLKKRLIYKRFLLFYLAIFVGGLFLLSGFRKISLSSFLLENWQSMVGIMIVLISFSYAIMPGVLVSENFRDVDLRQREIKELSPAAAWPFPTSIRTSFEDEGFGAGLSRKENDQFVLYFHEMSALLQEKASVAEEKASLLLDKGSTYTLSGIIFFILSIISWQLLSWIHGFKVEFIYGIASCSGLFIFIEVLSGWYLKQYRHYVDTSTYLLKIKSIFDKFMLAYLSQDALAESDLTGKRLANKTLLSMLEKDIRWPNAYMLKKADANFAIEAVETLSKLSKRISKNNAKKEKEKSKEQNSKED